MKFLNLADLVNSVNRDLGDFCRKFQYERKSLLGKGRAASSTVLLEYSDSDRDWAINPGGGTEVQYHLAFDGDTITFGLGFNTQYVPFANDLSPVEYIRPHVESFLSQSHLMTGLVSHGFSYAIGSEENLKDIQPGKYVLVGKTLSTKGDEGGFVIDDVSYLEMLTDMKTILFETYTSIVSKAIESRKLTNAYSMQSSLLIEKKQIILQGPPGTGKTYTAKDLAEYMIRGAVNLDKKAQAEFLKGSEQFQLVQFHPSYSYEDFVRGITAKTNGIQVEYKTENKVLTKFAKTALDNLLDSGRSEIELTVQEWLEGKFTLFCEHIQNEIDTNGHYELTPSVAITGIEVENGVFRYNGHLWQSQSGQLMSFDYLKRGFLANVEDIASFKRLEGLSITAREHRATYYVNVIEKMMEFIDEAIPVSGNKQPPKRKDYVLIVDEINRANLPSVLGELIYALEYRGEPVESMYALEGGDASIVIPKNLYIIGTMNTADRSVAHIDYAIRRRFAFVDVLPSVDPIKHSNAIELFKKVEKLFTEIEGGRFKYLAPDFEPKDVQLGHSYFILDTSQPEEQQKAQLRMKLKYEILPILNEYVKDGLLNESAKKYIKEQIESFVI